MFKNLNALTKKFIFSYFIKAHYITPCVFSYSALLGQNLKTELAMDNSKDTIYSIGASTTVIVKKGKTLPQYVAAIIGKFLKYYNIRN
jgi:hydroxymethylpyrimidine/phosphomethylpyrimidine kinase